jgi:branched-chain amino acid transport system substrate-binding protein
MGDAGAGRVKVVTLWNAESASPAYQANFDAYKNKYGAASDPYSMGIRLEVDYLARAMEKAKSTDPAKVAAAMEGMKLESAFGMTEVRASDHQAISPLFVSTFVKSDGKHKYGADGAPEYAFRVEMKVEGPDTARPTTCKMRRP